MGTFSLRDTLARLLLALACGAVIGLNRDLHRKSAGFRTFGLVSVGSAIVALVITQVSPDVNAVSRVIQGVLTGIGFLGAGVILHQPTSSRVTGLTTAAAVWLTAGLGLACGLHLPSQGLGWRLRFSSSAGRSSGFLRSFFRQSAPSSRAAPKMRTIRTADSAACG